MWRRRALVRGRGWSLRERLGLGPLRDGHRWSAQASGPSRAAPTAGQQLFPASLGQTRSRCLCFLVSSVSWSFYLSFERPCLTVRWVSC